jgi:hypothetical protein
MVYGEQGDGHSQEWLCHFGDQDRPALPDAIPFPQGPGGNPGVQCDEFSRSKRKSWFGYPSLDSPPRRVK